MSNLTTLPKGDSAWLLRKSIQRIMQQVSVLETNIGSSTTGNSSDTQIIFNDAGTLRGDSGLTYNKTTDLLSVGAATITGDLTVATSALKVVSASNRVLINQASAIQGDSLEVSAKSNAGTISMFGRASDNMSIVAFRANGATTQKASIQGSDAGFQFITGSTTRYTIDSTGIATWSEVGGVAGTAMTLNANGLGVGGSPTSKLSIFAGADGDVGFFRGGSTRQLQIGTSATAGYLNADNGSAGFELRVNGTARAYFDTSGNVGIGVSTFGTSAAKVLGLANATAPSTSPAGMGQLYVEAGALKYRGSSGTVTTIAAA